MEQKITIYIILILIIGVFIGAFFTWQNHEKTERQYQACLDKCEAQSCGFGAVLKGEEGCEGCKAGCREKYGK